MRPNLVLGTGQCQLTQESIWAIWSWGFATPDTDTEALGAHLLLLLPFSPPVGSGARWAHFPYLYLVLPSVSPHCRAPTLLGPIFACGWRSSPAQNFCAQGKPSLSAQDLQKSSSCCRSSSSIRSLCTPGASRLLCLKAAERCKSCSEEMTVYRQHRTSLRLQEPKIKTSPRSQLLCKRLRSGLWALLWAAPYTVCL